MDNVETFKCFDLLVWANPSPKSPGTGNRLILMGGCDTTAAEIVMGSFT